MKYLFPLPLLLLSHFSLKTMPTALADAPAVQTSLQDSSRSISLKAALPFPIGAAVKVYLLKNNAIYRNVLTTQFNSISPENAMKFGAVHPSANVFKFNDADYIVRFAQQNNMRLHAHTLIWAKNNPKWVNEYQGDESAWRDLLKTHIQTVVSHFKGKVAAWDVVNEAFEDNGKLKKSVWMEHLGPEYIAMAFQFAHEADPDVPLFYNDYGQEYGGPKLTAILKMVNDFKRRGVPISGLGFQMHTVLRVNVDNFKKNLDKAAATGLLIHLSELDISVRKDKPKTFELDRDLAVQQAAKYKAIISAYLSIPKKQQYGVTTWGISDRDTFWNKDARQKNHDYPMLFDRNYKPKPAVEALIDAVSGR